MWTAIAGDTLCSSDVSQRCASAPQLGRFCEQFQAWQASWLGREGSNLRMGESKSPALPLGYAPMPAAAGPVRRGDPRLRGSIGRLPAFQPPAGRSHGDGGARGCRGRKAAGRSDASRGRATAREAASGCSACLPGEAGPDLRRTTPQQAARCTASGARGSGVGGRAGDRLRGTVHRALRPGNDRMALNPGVRGTGRRVPEAPIPARRC